MVATELTRRPHHLIVALATVWLLTAAAAGMGTLAPALAPAGHPHPTLHGTLGDALSILATNLRLLSVPFLLVLLGFRRGRCTRHIGDALVAGLVTVNACRVGLALGRFGSRLVPYIPQLPVEWLALALSTAAWMSAREEHRPVRSLVVPASQVAATAIVAAALETWVTPHAR
jgi:hypothetical protein